MPIPPIKRKRSSLLAGLPLTLMILAGLPGLAGAVVPIDAMKAATVRVFCKSPVGGISSGSGVLVGTGDAVVTNNHVVECTGFGGELLVVHSQEQRTPAKVIWKTEGKDLAVLRLQNRVSGTVPSFATSEQVSDAQTVYAMGFPGAADLNKESLFQVKITKGIISSRSTVEGVRIYQTDAAINNGNSGGPLFNDSGQVIGINFAKKSGIAVEGIGYAIQADELLPELDRLAIPYRKAASTAQPNAPIPVAPTTPAPQPASPNDETAPPSQPGSSQPVSSTYLLYLAIGIAIVLSGTAIFLTTTQHGRELVRSCRNTTSRGWNNGQNQHEVTSLGGIHPLFRGVSGAFAGNEFKLGLETILFGRDPHQCQVVFPSDMTEVGRHHCSLSYDRKSRSFILTDLQSTNGTFWGDGDRLKPGASIRIPDGDRFYLANRQQMFEVRLMEEGR